VSKTIGVIVFPGSNCDHDAYHAMKHVMGADTKFLWHKDNDLKDIDLLIIPGGFSYGDYLRSGAIARFSPIMQEVVKYAEEGRPVMGICNGFQILLESGLLPGAMLHNEKLRFVCKNVYIRVENNQTIFTSDLEKGEVLDMPVSHGEGNYFIESDGLKQLHDNDQIVFRYCNSEGQVTHESNFNGSVDSIAGICNNDGNVLGLMPHPERAVEEILGSTDGKKLFKAVLDQLTLV
jgi:phosphoribosylformylglycinamidine synthase subunit PurQ / glutaminase